MKKRQRHPQVRNPFERRPPKRSEIAEAKALARAVSPKVFAMFDAREKADDEPGS